MSRGFLKSFPVLLNATEQEKEMNELMQSLMGNVIFVLEFMGIVLLCFLLAYGAEKYVQKKTGKKEKILNTRKITMIGMFSAIATILHILDFPVPFAPPFYKMDFSELPALVGTFAFGPVAGIMIEFCKIILKLLFKSTSTAFVGELANFVIGCSFLLPASIIYLFRKNKKNAIIGCVTGTIIMTVFGTIFNAVYLLPKFAQLYGMPLESIIEMGTVINPAINSVTTLAILAVGPMNILKGGLVSIITLLIYKKLSPILKISRKE